MFVLETVASYKHQQDHCLGRKNLLPRHLLKISVSFKIKARFLGFVFVQYIPSFTLYTDRIILKSLFVSNSMSVQQSLL